MHFGIRNVAFKWIQLVIIIFPHLMAFIGAKPCARDKSRTVARLIIERILPTFRSMGVSLDPNCPYSLERNIFGIQEDNKVFEGTSRWTCNFCGKAFVSEFFLDRHFENRHPGTELQTEDAVCLADVCDVFRCDIISGLSLPDYWEVALCLEDDMEELSSQCRSLTNACLPRGLTKNETEMLNATIHEHICSFLTCSKFWDTPFHQEDSSHTALYIVLTTMTCFGILIYNFVFYNYFYSDLTEGTFDPTPKVKHRIKPATEELQSARYRRGRRHLEAA